MEPTLKSHKVFDEDQELEPPSKNQKRYTPSRDRIIPPDEKLIRECLNMSLSFKNIFKSVIANLNYEGYICYEDDHAPRGSIYRKRKTKKILLVVDNEGVHSLRQEYRDYAAWMTPFSGSFSQCKNPFYVSKDGILHLTIRSQGMTLYGKETDELISKGTTQQKGDNGSFTHDESNYLYTADRLQEIANLLELV